jgi:hypothetical protein
MLQEEEDKRVHGTQVRTVLNQESQIDPQAVIPANKKWQSAQKARCDAAAAVQIKMEMYAKIAAAEANGKLETQSLRLKPSSMVLAVQTSQGNNHDGECARLNAQLTYHNKAEEPLESAWQQIYLPCLPLP